MFKLIQSLVDDAKPLNTKSYDDLIKLVKEYYDLWKILMITYCSSLTLG